MKKSNPPAKSKNALVPTSTKVGVESPVGGIVGVGALGCCGCSTTVCVCPGC